MTDTTFTPPKSQYHYAKGNRKTAVARVRVYEKGEGEIYVNGQPLVKWADTMEGIQKVKSPLKLTGNTGKFTISIKVEGSGKNAQYEAARHGIARVLQEMQPDTRPTLKKAGYLTRDPRMKERKKPGLKSARRSPQFSKR